MRAWRKITGIVFLIAVIIVAGVNLLWEHLEVSQNGRPYRVEINRIARQIEQSGPESVDLAQCEYVQDIVEFGDDFYNAESDYVIREIDGALYRFDYAVKGNGNVSWARIAVNVSLAGMSALLLCILFFVRREILRPFEQLAEIPYALSKGNLTLPVTENKNRFLGKFLWGVDLLREHVEEQKQRELELQKEKKTLLLSLSHDMKTPLSAIKLYAKALSKNLYAGEKKQQEIADKIHEKADEIESYIAQIVTASREDFLRLDTKNGEFYLADLVAQITAYYCEKLALVKTELFVGKYNNCLIFGDFDRSVEVLQNVIENAVKYGDGKRIELLFPDEEESVLISVRNSGRTIRQADLPHIFESFWRGANSENIPGSGLGLYICRQLMHNMNGEIFSEIDGDSMTVTAVFQRA